MRDDYTTTIGFSKGDARSLDYSSHRSFKGSWGVP